MIWTEEAIRDELRRLDAVTGLNGAALPIEFTNARRVLGSFCHSDIEPLCFRFSRPWMTGDDLAHAQAIDVIRHEYAHYMDYMDRGTSSHGRQWKDCCRRIGAEPAAHFNHLLNYYYLLREQEAREREAVIARYAPGADIMHPSYGAGTIVSCSGDGASRRITVRFGDGQRMLSVAWVVDNCTLMPDAALSA